MAHFDISEEVAQNTTDVTKQGLRMALNLLANHLNFGSSKNLESTEVGEQTIEDLNRSFDTKEMIEVHNEHIDELRAELKRYKVDFAVVEVPRDEQTGAAPIYRLVFKAKDVAIINSALKIVAEKFGEKSRMDEQFQQAEEKAKRQAQEKTQDKERDVNRTKDRGEPSL